MNWYLVLAIVCAVPITYVAVKLAGWVEEIIDGDDE